MSEFVSFDILTENSEPIRCARLVGDGWNIEVTRHDEHTVEVRCWGDVIGGDRLLIVPACSNAVLITTDVESGRRVSEEARAMHETWKANDKFWRSKEKAT